MSKKRYDDFKSHMEKPINTDGTRCELLRQQYRPFIHGGDVAPVIQCPNKATVKIISHADHEKDIPPMFLCNTCLKLFKRDNAENLSDYEIIAGSGASHKPPMRCRDGNRRKTRRP
jgi:hypothetical protein